MENTDTNQIPAHVFKAYDIRGLVDGEITEELAYRVGQAMVKFTGAKAIVVGHDMRETSPVLTKALMEGVMSQGANVVFIGGEVTTAVLYYACAAYDAHEAGIMVTASHNPVEYNGIKMCRNDAQPIGGTTGIFDIRDIVRGGRLPDADVKGTLSKLDVVSSYLDKVFENFDAHSCVDLEIVVDTGNGMQGAMVHHVFDRLPTCSFHGMFLELDGTFPNHEANPLKEETLDELKAKIKELGANLGIGFDGDGDRIGFVDENGKAIRGDILGALIAPHVLKNHPGSMVIYDVRCSMAVVEEIKKAGGVAEMYQVGHGLIKPHMKEKDACLGIELSMHYYFKDFYYVDATDYCMLLVLELMTKTGKKLSELIAPLNRYHHSGEINSEVEDKQGVMDGLVEKYGSLEGATVSTIDGIRIDFRTENSDDDWWFNVRPSNTEPLLRLNLEAKDKGFMEEKREELLKLIRG